jgi:NADH:ubiquinone oxidoreductase subunit 6 (subunit J)
LRNPRAMVSEDELSAALVFRQRRLRTAAIALALTLGATSAALTSIILTLVNVSALPAQSGAVIVLVLVTTSMATVWWRRLTLAHTAALVERRAPGLENLVVTASEVLSVASRPLHPMLRDALFREAAERLHQVPPRLVQPLTLPVAIAVGTLIASIALIVRLPWH